MIGTQVRGFHHLSRLVESSPRTIIYSNGNSRIRFGKVVKVSGRNVPGRGKQDFLYIYNNEYGNDKPSPEPYRNTPLYNVFIGLNNQWGHVLKVNLDQSSMKYISDLITLMWLVPEDFTPQYKKFCDENKKQFEVVNRKYVSQEDSMAKFFYCLANGSKNYFFWVVALHYAHRVPICTIKRVLDWANNYSQLSKKLKKGTVTGYTTFSQIDDLLLEITELRRNKRINDVINSFNTAQKKLLKERVLSNRDIETLSKFGKLSSVKKSNFIRKMSTIGDTDEIMRQMAYVVNIHFEWDKDSLIDYIKNTENLHAEIVSIKGNIVLVKVNDYDAVKYLGKSTNWCISKNKTYWNNYIGDGRKATQYMIFDFSKPEDDEKSIIGFTSVFNRGITNAHDFTNHNLMTDNPRRRQRRTITSFLDKFNVSSGIFSILEKDGIKLSEVTSYDKIPYKWNRESFFEHFHKYIQKGSYEIAYDNDGKLVLIVLDSGICDFLGEQFKRSTNRDVWKREFIIFADFNSSETDPNKLTYGIVSQNSENYESYVDTLYNEHFENAYVSFDYKLAEFGLPYDIICRTDDPCNRFRSAFFNFEMPIVNQLIKDERVVNAILENEIDISGNEYYSVILDSIISHHSFDIIKVFYDNGIKLGNVMNSGYIDSLIGHIFSTMASSKGGRYKNMTMPSDATFKSYNDGTLSSRNDCIYISLMLIMDLIMEHEEGSRIYNNMVSSIANSDTKAGMLTHFMKKAISAYDFNKPNDYLFYSIRYAFKCNIPELLSLIASKMIKCNHSVNEWAENFEAEYKVSLGSYSPKYV